jgi:hypothetical protein
MSEDEDTIAKAAADRAAIERWEGEGGRALAPEKSPSAGPGEIARANLARGTSMGTRSRARSGRERDTRS